MEGKLLNISALHKRREDLQKTFERLKKASQEADGRMVSRYDTQKEDFAREAELVQQVILKLDEQISYLSRLPTPNQCDQAEAGHIVTLKMDGDQPSDYLLVDVKGGGAEIGEIHTLGINTPVGKAILGKSIGSQIAVNLPGGVAEVRLLAIKVMENS